MGEQITAAEAFEQKLRWEQSRSEKVGGHLEVVERQPTYRELIDCITAASKLPPGYVKEDMLKELTVLLHRINNPPVPLALQREEG